MTDAMSPPPSGPSSPTKSAPWGPTSPTKDPRLKVIPAEDVETLCRLCHFPSQTELDLGKLYELVAGENDVYIAHYHCLLFSAGLEQGGEDNEGIMVR